MLDWDDFDKFDEVINKYMPDFGEGETKASQIATAINKLVYKWFNDGDVFDNSVMQGWANDLSSYANWIYNNSYSAEVQAILWRIFATKTDKEYTQLLYDLCEKMLDPDYIDKYNLDKKVGTIYSCDGPFEFTR